MDKFLVTEIILCHRLNMHTEASCQSHTSGLHHCPALDTKTGAPLSVTKACGNLKQLHISHFTPFYPPLSHNSQDGSREGQSRCTTHERPEQRAVQSQSVVTWAPRMMGPDQCHPEMSVTTIRVKTGMCGNGNHRSHTEMECSWLHLSYWTFHLCCF